MICRQCQFDFADDMSACPVCRTSAAKVNPWLEAFPSPEGPALPSNPWAGYEPPMPESIFRTEASASAGSGAGSGASGSAGGTASGEVRASAWPGDSASRGTASGGTASRDSAADSSARSVWAPVGGAVEQPSQPLIVAIDESSVLVSGVIDDEHNAPTDNHQTVMRERDSAKIVLYIALGMFLVMAIALVLVLV